VDALLEFAKGPFFKFSFALMILGSFRIVALSFFGVGEALFRAGDRKLNYGEIVKNTFSWLFPVRRWATGRPVYSLISIVFHVGLILVPFFLAAHIGLWKRATGLSWPAMPQIIADGLTVVVIFGGPALFLGRLFHRGARAISRLQDYVWPLMLTAPALTGFLCANGDLSAGAYQFWMLIHVVCADLIMIFIPFTKLAHFALMPMTQLVAGIGWKFRVGAGSRIERALGKRGQMT
jgi:nitrate reductase gamma subunit